MKLKERIINFIINFIINLFKFYDTLTKLQKYILLILFSIIVGLIFTILAIIIPYPFRDKCVFFRIEIENYTIC